MSVDPRLLAAVERAGESFCCCDDEFHASGDVERWTVALAAAGRVLADLARERQADVDRAQNVAVEGGFPGYASRLAAQAAALGELADVWLPRWCGVDAGVEDES